MPLKTADSLFDYQKCIHSHQKYFKSVLIITGNQTEC